MSAERRRALILLSEDVIAHMLDFPEDLRVAGIRDDFMRNGILVMVEGESLEPVPANAQPPWLAGAWERDAESDRMRFYVKPFDRGVITEP